MNDSNTKLCLSGEAGRPESDSSERVLTSLGRSETRFRERFGAIEDVVKRAFDMVVAVVASIIVGPLVLVLAVLVRLDGGPAFYRQERIGRNGKPFGILKLRSMIVNAEEVLANDPALTTEYIVNYTLVRDPRVTRLGRVMRACYLDELPQFVNVIRGEMSVVGPRPVLREETLRYGELRDLILSVRPGITGWWQTQKTLTTSYEHRIQMEAWYARHHSLFLDCGIAVVTLLRVAGACFTRL